LNGKMIWKIWMLGCFMRGSSKDYFDEKLHLKANLAKSIHAFYQSLSPFGITFLGGNVEAHLSWWHKHAKLFWPFVVRPLWASGWSHVYKIGMH
jgi:hypothetical protein